MAIQEVVEERAGYKKTKLGWIPDEWDILTINDIGKVVTGGTPSTNQREYWNDDHLWFTPSDINHFLKFADYSKRRISSEGLKNSSATLFPKGTIMVCTRATIGELAISKFEASTNQGFKNLIVNEKNDVEYIFYLLSQYKNVLIKLSSGSTFLELSTNDFRMIKFALPSIQEQKTIANCLSTWDVAIEKQTQLIQAKQTQKKALMQQLLTGKKRLPRFTEEWEEQKLGEFFEERKETNSPDLPLLSIGELGVYPQTESNKKDTSNKDKSKYKRICPGDIGYNTMRMWQGRSALSNLEGIVSPAYTIVSPKANTDANFFSYFFKFPPVVHKFYRNSQGLVSDTLNCKFKDFSIVKVILPKDKKEQTAIAKVLNAADKEIALLQQQLQQLQKQKKGLMQQLLTGKKRLKY